ncbi:coiled-coil domain-containing protein 34 isoform X4 [Notechis scutatus]|uniref:Coiled-coil domain-containing protein 34 isoform X4 n=1 Tax=Notechis scutatus TaxID=8663 RepID=A0A6J1TY95_9SAUR|nr:coiled-coil domain-containing protein 34 isoform X4 [Notechis scutatus]
MPTSEPPKSRREAVYSSPASSDDEGAGKSSTFSLISDSFHPELSDFHHGGEGETTTTSRGSSIPQKMKHHHSLEQIKDTNKLSPVHNSLSPWEEWFLCKERELRARLQMKALEEMNQQMEETKEKQERERKKLIAEEKHKEWVQKKNEEVKREKEKLREAELQEKKEKSERMFKEWLQNSKNKPRPASAGCAYVNGKLATYPDGNAYPAPAFYNPIPWKPIPAPPPKEEKYVSVKKNKRPLSSHTHRSSSVLFQKSKSNVYLGSLHRLHK